VGVAGESIIKHYLVVPFVKNHFAAEGKINVVLVFGVVVSDKHNLTGPCASAIAGL
jgi:hypothetical protein